MKTLLLVPFLFMSLKTYSQNLKTFLGPKVWLKADQTGNVSGRWSDQSGENNHASPVDSIDFTQGGYINYNKAVGFSQPENILEIPIDLSQVSELTVFTEYETEGETGEKNIWSVKTGQGDITLSTQKVNSLEGVAKYSEGNIDQPVLNTSVQYWNIEDDNTGETDISLGGTLADSSSFRGKIAEFMVFDRVLSDIEIKMVQTYLSIKYGATLQYSDYVSSSGNTIWDYEENAGYSYAITGIGRDDNFGLYQKQSANAENTGLLTIGLREIAVSNDANTTLLNNEDFLIWGMNNGDVTAETSADTIYPYAVPVMNRKWLMCLNGTGMKTKPTQLVFNVKDIIGESGECSLVIDRSGQGDFSSTSSSLAYIKADTLIHDSIAVFSGVKWDTDNNGKDVFTLSTGMDNGVTCTQPMCHDETTGMIHMEIMGGTAPYKFSLENKEKSYKREWSGGLRFQEVENLVAGTYHLVVTDNSGKSAANTIEINNPDEFTTGLDSACTIDLGQELVLDAGKNLNDKNATYLWQSDNGFESTDREVSLYQPGLYSVTVTNEKGCSVTENITVKLQNGLTYNYRLYPNPSSGNFKLEAALAEASPVTIRIYDVQGGLVYEESRQGDSRYTFSGFIDRQGVYLFEVKSNAGTETFKFIVTGN